LLSRLPIVKPKRVVRNSYEAIATRYLEWAESVRVRERRRYTQLLVRELGPGSRVLDLGCGPGGSTSRALANRFRVVGVDISWANVALAKAAVPNAWFVQGDMTEIQFRPHSFDGAAAFYSLIHVPREEQGKVIAHLSEWLRPGGLLTLSLGVGDHEVDMEEDWLGGLPMFWSSYSREKYRRLIEDAGFDVISAQDEVDDEFGETTTFHWVVARRSADDRVSR
jgi:ubiquinone/menaquinone biosynthesis C-methylase UbiE